MSAGTGGGEQNSAEVNEVLRRIGRNLLLYQQIEHLLRFLIGSARVDGPVGSFQARSAKRRAGVHKQTLGQVADRFVDEVLADAGDHEAPEHLEDAWLSFSFSIDADDAFVEQHEADMTAIVAERNDLVHHFLPRWTPASEESTQSALTFLDEQRANALPMRDRLSAYAKSLREAASECAAYLASPEFEVQFAQAHLRRSRLVQMLVELAARTERPDGWMTLATAGQVIHRHEPQELASMAERHGHRTLKKLLQATGMFDIDEEPTPRGGTRTIYRLKPEFAAHHTPA